MTTPYRQKLKKALATSAIILGVSLGLCGLNILGVNLFPRSPGMGSVFVLLGFIELAAIIVSFLVLVLVAILMAHAAIFGCGDSQ